MQNTMASAVPEFALQIFSHMRGGATRGCRILSASRARVAAKAGQRARTKKAGARRWAPARIRVVPSGYDLVAGLTPGLSLKNCLFSSM
jgi:hypothetical protein